MSSFHRFLPEKSVALAFGEFFLLIENDGEWMIFKSSKSTKVKYI